MTADGRAAAGAPRPASDGAESGPPNPGGDLRRSGLFWLTAGTCMSVGAHFVATGVARLIGQAMRGTSDLATQAIAANQPFDEPYIVGAFVVVTTVSVAYLFPLIRFLWRGGTGEATPAVMRRAISAPLALSVISIVPWVGGIATFVGVTVTTLGRWSDDMISEQVISPALSGFVAATAQYLMLEWVFRERIVPLVFPSGGLRAVRRAPFLPVAARLVVLAFALGFIPAFALIGVIAAANDRVVAGLADAGIVESLQRNAQRIFVFFIVTGAAYVLMFARSLTVPLAELTRALAGIREGNLDVRVPVRTRDEIGSLAEGVNELAQTLREKGHILGTFGRVVDPAVRDRLLAGDLSPRGERRDVAMLFADVRAFTLMAERRPPEEVVATLNELFGIMSAGVKRAGGTVDKFVGDAMLAVFGLFDDGEDAPAYGLAAASPDAPSSSRAAAAAIQCAIHLRRELESFAAARDEADAVRVLISVHAGSVVAATLGAEDRFDYTVVGDAVNVTSRLLDVAKERGRDVVVSAEAVRRARESGSTIRTDWCGPVELRGRSAPIEVCTISGA